MALNFSRFQRSHRTDATGSNNSGGRTALRGVAIVLGLALLGGTLTATAASAKPAAPKVPAPSGNCVVALGTGAAKTDCFGTFTEAASFATKGAVTNARANAADAVNDSAFNALVESPSTLAAKTSASSSANRAAAASYIISIEYDGTGYSGSSLIYTGTHTCTGTTADNEYQIILSSAWWDRISSYRTYNNCWVKHYYFQNFTSQNTGYLSGRTPMPVVGGINYNNNARALRWS